MFFDFKFWKYLTNPQQLAGELQRSSMRGFKKRILFVFLIGILLFAMRDFWGMGTESMTHLLTTKTTADYIIARYISIVGAGIWAIIYMSFHIFGIAYILSTVTVIPYKKIIPLQLLTTGILLIEKALVFGVFAIKGATANVSFLSLGPLAVTFLDYSYITVFLNQLTLTTAVIIALQFKFIRSYTGIRGWKGIFGTLLIIHISMALITAAIGFIPIEDLFRVVLEGGVGHE